MAKQSSDLRNSIRQQRRKLSHNQQRAHAKLLAKHLIRCKSFLNSQRVACYLPNDSEIDPSYIIENAWITGKELYLPVLAPLDKKLYFAPYTPDTDMYANKFGIAEPACHKNKWLSAQQLDLILLPLVAFDDKGNRLGMGGGYYDRSLAFKKRRSLNSKPILIGLAHTLQQTNKLTRQSWDIPLDAIATEEAFLII